MFENQDLIKKDKQGRFPKDDTRYRTFIFVLYKDSESYDYEEVLNTMKGECKYWVYIEHKAEKNELKDHTHCIIYYDNPRFADSVANKLGIPKNFLQIPLSTRGCMRYLTHIDYPDKIQYDLQMVNVSTSFMKRFYEAYNDEKIDIEILQDIYQFINDNTNLDSVDLEVQLSLFVCSSSYNRIFKAYYNTITKYIKEKCTTSYNIYYVNFYIFYI